MIVPLLVAALGGAPASGDDLEGRVVSAIRIDGLKYTKETLVRRELKSREGEPF